MWYLKKFEISCTGRNTQKQIQKKNINPNPKDSDQRERKTQAAATQVDPSHDNPGARASGLGRVQPGATWASEHQAGVSCGLGLMQLGATQARDLGLRLARLGHRGLGLLGSPWPKSFSPSDLSL